MQTIHFNTRRAYTSKGQRITATWHDDGVVTFYDHDRMIDGEFPRKRLLPTQELTSDFVMRVYDANQFTGTLRSRQDGMMRNGCNATFVEKV
jgi:hypothetical protein